MVAAALVRGSGFRRIMVVKPRAGVATDEVPKPPPAKIRQIPLPDSQLARAWRKLHLAVDTDTGEIVASDLTSRRTPDGPLPP